jgi:hypothetical protein
MTSVPYSLSAFIASAGVFGASPNIRSKPPGFVYARERDERAWRPAVGLVADRGWRAIGNVPSGESVAIRFFLQHRRGGSMAFILTRIHVGDYDVWKPMFDQDVPGARQAATRHRIMRNVDDPNEVFLQVEFASAEEARTGREKLLASGVLDRFQDKSGPTIVEEAEVVDY